MTDAAAPTTETDPLAAVLDRQLAILGEVAEMALVVSRAYASASVAAAHAVEVALADEEWQPETARSRALAGAKDAADSFQKVTRAVRLTLMLQTKAAEQVRDLRLGVWRPREAGGSPAVRSKDQAASLCLDGNVASRCSDRTAGDLAGSSARGDVKDKDARDRDTERLMERERLETILSLPFRETVERICVDLGATIDWKDSKVGRPDLDYRSLERKPAVALGFPPFVPIPRSPKPPGFIRRRDPPGPADPEAAVPSQRTASSPS